MDEYINPNPNAKLLLEQLGLSHLPSRDKVFQEIEEKLLLPRVKLAPHSLAKYQMYDSHLSDEAFLMMRTDTGSVPSLSLHFYH